MGSELPAAFARYLAGLVLQRGRYALLLTDAGGLLRRATGDLKWFGLDGIEPGTSVGLRHDALEDLFPPPKVPECLPLVQMAPGRRADLHFGPTADGGFVFLEDASESAAKRIPAQQRSNEASLLVRALDAAVLERVAEGELHLISQPPRWMSEAFGDELPARLGEEMPFLDNFLVDAEAHWNSGSSRPLWSGTWCEEPEGGEERFFEAAALCRDGHRKLLVIQELDRRSQEKRELLQVARNASLEHEKLRREIDRKEILLHCIIHDLKGPLSGMVGTMSLVKSRDLDRDRARELLELGLEQARYQESMIRTILEAFTAEIESLESFESQASRAPDLLRCLERVLEGQRPAFERSRVELQALPAPDLPKSCKVVGHERRLERVLANLLDNALRVSPAGTRVRVLVDARGDTYRLRVEDQGPGVSPEAVAGLFEKFHRGAGSGGVAGLGLYFCRSTLETWGGSIGYEPAAGGGACFRISLSKAL